MSFKVTVDYPSDGEKIRSGHFAVRVSALRAGEAQVSVNKSAWETCRASNGYFWFDFWPEPHEIYQISARARRDGEDWSYSEDRYCDVVE